MTDPAMERLRQLTREVEAAYDAVQMATPAEEPAAQAMLEHALAREAEAARVVLGRRMPSVAQSDEELRRALELIARKERGDG